MVACPAYQTGGLTHTAWHTETQGAFSARRDRRELFPPDATAGSFFRPTRPQGAFSARRDRRELRSEKGFACAQRRLTRLRPFRPKLRFAACRAERRVFSARRDRRELRSEKGFACAKSRLTRCSGRSDRNFASLRVGRNGAFFPPDATAGSFGRKKVSLAPSEGSPAASVGKRFRYVSARTDRLKFRPKKI